MRLLLTVTMITALSGCGPSTTRPGPLYEGRAESAPTLECMPDPDVTDESFTLHMRRGRELAEASFEVPDPEIPAEHTASALTA